MAETRHNNTKQNETRLDETTQHDNKTEQDKAITRQYKRKHYKIRLINPKQDEAREDKTGKMRPNQTRRDKPTTRSRQGKKRSIKGNQPIVVLYCNFVACLVSFCLIFSVPFFLYICLSCDSLVLWLFCIAMRWSCNCVALPVSPHTQYKRNGNRQTTWWSSDTFFSAKLDDLYKKPKP